MIKPLHNACRGLWNMLLRKEKKNSIWGLFILLQMSGDLKMISFSIPPPPKFMPFTQTQTLDLSFYFSKHDSQCITLQRSKGPLPADTGERNDAQEWLFLAHSTCRFRGNCQAIKREETAKCCNKMSVFMINSIVKGHYAILLNLYQCGDCVNTEGNIIHPNQIKQAAVKLNQ